MSKRMNIGIIGLGYVGLPLAIEFAKKYQVLGFDIDSERVGDLSTGVDKTNEANLEELNIALMGNMDAGTGLKLASTTKDLKECNVYIVTVPTPVDQQKKPDLTYLLAATKMIGELLKKGDIVIYESTVYPGCTEEDCVPILEETSGLKFNIDFFCGYSPERINPGDKINTLTKIMKVTSGSTSDIARHVDQLYASIIPAGTYLAPSIKVAEASKAIENAQRDVNISFVNELALIFDRMGIDTTDVLAAAATKWNFLNYKPGLVGGHCISVDPYYLAYKAEKLGYTPEVILSGRRVNDNMGAFFAQKIVKLMIAQDRKIQGAKALILGFSFKENCPDFRNTKVIDIHFELSSYGMQPFIYDPWVDTLKVQKEYNLEILSDISDQIYDVVILAVAHERFSAINFSKLKSQGTLIFDTKSFIERSLVDGRL